jgi:hypothetical protein
MNEPFIEREHEGRKFESGGSYIVGDKILAYMSSDMKHVTTWHGDVLGAARIKSSWRMNQWSPIGGWRMYQVETTIDGVRYTGRTMGGSMVYHGKRKR